jgi:hypothetical protein
LTRGHLTPEARQECGGSSSPGPLTGHRYRWRRRGPGRC